MEPKLAFAFSSNSGNGLLGLDWRIDGISQIGRCATTLVQDGFIDGVDYDTNDKLCLDGKRLVLVAGTYGTNLAEYRTEIDTFSKVVQYGSINADGVWFKVWTKSGEIYEYGNRDNAAFRIEKADGTFGPVRVWSVNRISDTAGNYIDFKYSRDASTGETVPESVNYTGNLAANVTPYNRVAFEYEARPDVTSAYDGIGSKKVVSSKRLAAVAIYAGLDLAARYKVEYKDSSLGSGRSRVAAISQCDDDGNCFEPTRFVWDDTSQKLTYSENVQYIFDNDIARMHVGDWDGNGLHDFLYYNYQKGTQVWYQNKGDATKITTEYAPQSPLPTGSVSNGDGELHFGDWNADGITDVMWFRPKTGANNWWLNNGDGTFSEQYTSPIPSNLLAGEYAQLEFLDFNSDGYVDIAYYDTGSGTNRWFVSNQNMGWDRKDNILEPALIKSSFRSTRLLFGDWNGDRLKDVAFVNKKTGHNVWYVNEGITYDSTLKSYFPNFTIKRQDAIDRSDLYSDAIVIDGNGRSREFYIGDWNADGIDDFVMFDRATGKNAWYINNGDNKYTMLGRRLLERDRLDNYGKLHFGDWNADGITDVAFYRPSGANIWYLNDGEANFTICGDPGVTRERVNDKTGNIQFGDWNGDGIIDFSWYNPSAGRIWWFTNNSAEHEMLRTITNGLGASVSIEYAPLTDSSVYTRTAEIAGAGTQKLQTSNYVVKSYKQTNALGGLSTTSYKYTDLIADLTGRGILGFKSIFKMDLDAKVGVQTNYRVDFPFTGLASETTTYRLNASAPYAPAAPISVNSQTFASKKTTGKGAPRYFVYAQHQENKSFDGLATVSAGGQSKPLLLSIETIDTTYDSYGSVVEMISKVEEINGADGVPQASAPVYTTMVRNAYSDNVSKWQLGRLTSTTVSKTKSGDSDPATRTSTFAYDATTGFLVRESAYVGTDSETSTVYEYDNFGNKIKSTITTVDDQTGRTTSAQFDSRGQFPIKKTNALGHAETYTYDGRTGQQLSLTGPNGLTTTWEYDGMGRLTKEIRADGTYTRQEYLACTAQMCPSGNGKFATKTTGSDGSQKIVAVNVLEKTVSESTLGADGDWIDQITQYDKQGRPIKASMPFYRGHTVYYATSTYDALNRVTAVAVPKGDGSNAVDYTRTSYRGFSTTTTDANGKKSTKQVDALGNLTQVTDALGNSTKYYYDAFNNLTRVEDAKDNKTFVWYDEAGRKIEMYDYDTETTQYEYNGYGDLISQTDNKGQKVTMVYDALGRMTSRTSVEGTDRWGYDSQWIGALDGVTAADGFKQQLAYNSLGRLVRKRTIIAGEKFDVSQSFDDQGRLWRLTYPNGLRVDHEYSASGYLDHIVNPDTQVMYWNANEYDAAGRVNDFQLGNGLNTIRFYNPTKGYLQEVITGSTIGTEIQSLTYEWDPVGNLLSRTDQNQAGLIEEFQYDALNRLVQVEGGNGESSLNDLFLSYDSIGNIAYKSDVGSYHYANRPHAVVSIDEGPRPGAYTYDANGNMLTAPNRRVQWTSFNKPRAIVRAARLPADGFYKGGALTYSDASAFSYAPDRSLYQQVRNQTAKNGFTQTKINYVGGLYERHDHGNGDIEHRAYIQVNGETIAIEVDHGNNDATRYLHRDHLGSVTAITDASGKLIEQLAYDAFGKRRNIDWQADNAKDDLLYNSDYLTDIGFTGHEQLDNVGLVNMQGRHYDPLIGRFISADTLIPSPETTQGYNRYTYVYNNPLSYTDPDGHNPFAAFAIIAGTYLTTVGIIIDHKQMTSVGVSLLVAGVSPGLTPVEAAGVGFGAGFAASGGNVKAGLYSAATAYAFGRAGQIQGPVEGASAAAKAGYYAKMVVIHGAIGGVSSDLQGGSFRSGFFAAAATKAVSPVINPNGKFAIPTSQARVFAAAIIGGTASELSGGKFGNGAMTGAFSQAFNAEGCRDGCVEQSNESWIGRLKSNFSDFVSGFWESARENVQFGTELTIAGGPGTSVSSAFNGKGDTAVSAEYVKGYMLKGGAYVKGDFLKSGSISGAYQSVEVCFVTCIGSQFNYQGDYTLGTKLIFPPAFGVTVGGGYTADPGEW
ncbi:RHS repeat-associated core domain protein [Salinisphaera sp. T5B8]